MVRFPAERRSPPQTDVLADFPMQFPRARILLFTKAPVPGRVKTRLIPALGAQAAADLYRELLHATVIRIQRAGIAPLICCCAPSAEHREFLQLQRQYGVSLETQLGSDLGERMRQAATHHLTSSAPELLIGCDSPVLQPVHLRQALQWLNQGCDAVLGPAEDGGYLLLGLNRVSPELFRGIAWGGAEVLAETRSRLLRLGWRWRELETLWDLDRPSDLDRLQPLASDSVEHR